MEHLSRKGSLHQTMVSENPWTLSSIWQFRWSRRPRSVCHHDSAHYFRVTVGLFYSSIFEIDAKQFSRFQVSYGLHVIGKLVAVIPNLATSLQLYAQAHSPDLQWPSQLRPYGRRSVASSSTWM